MDFVHDRSSNIIFSLHDSRVKKIEFQNGTLSLKVDTIFQYKNGKEKQYAGEILFYDCDLESCSIWMFNRIVEYGDFNGRVLSMEEYIDKYSHLEFEIISEGYFGYRATYTGWIWEEGTEPVSGIMHICNVGDMVYRIENSLFD